MGTRNEKHMPGSAERVLAKVANERPTWTVRGHTYLHFRLEERELIKTIYAPIRGIDGKKVGGKLQMVATEKGKSMLKKRGYEL